MLLAYISADLGITTHYDIILHTIGPPAGRPEAGRAARVQIYIYIYIHIYIYIYTYIYIYIYIEREIHIYIYMVMHTSIYIYIYIYMFDYSGRPTAGPPAAQASENSIYH